MFLLTLLIFTTLVVRGSSLNYFFGYYLDQGAIRTFLGQVGLGPLGDGPRTITQGALDALGLLVKPDGSNAASVGLSFFFVLGSLVQIVGIVFSKPLADRFGKKAVFITGMAVSTIATAPRLLRHPPRPSGSWSRSASSGRWAGGPTVPLLWVMIADVADYSEWRNSRRATGFMYAGHPLRPQGRPRPGAARSAAG